VLELGTRPGERDAPRAHDVGPVGERDRARDVLLHEQDGHTVLSDLADRLEEAIDELRSKSQRRLVEQEQPRLREQRAGDRQLLLLASGQRARRPPERFPEDREAPEHVLEHGRRSPPIGARGPAEQQVLAYSQRAEDVAPLEDEGDAAPDDCLRRNPCERLAEVRDRARRDRHKSEDRGEGRRLAGAVRPVELLLARSGALAATGRFADSHAVLLESTAIAPEDAVGLRVRLVAATASVEHLLGRHQQAHARLEAALAELPDSDSREAVALMIELAVDGLYRGAYEEIGLWAERAVAASAPLGDRSLVAASLAARALGSALSGVIAEAREHREEAAALIDMLTDDELARRLDALAHLATAEMYLDLFEHSGRHAERAVQLGRATGQGDLFPLVFPMLGTSLWVQGRMAESAEVFDGAIEHARLLDNYQGLAWNLFNRSFAALAAGDVEVALASARESIEIAKDLDESIVTGHAAWGLAAALLETGRAEEAAELLLASTGGEELSIIPGGWRANGLWLLTRCLVAAGRREEAERAAAAAAACGEAVGQPMALAMARLAEATIALDSGDGAAAAECGLDAAAALGEVGDAYHAALARILAGRALALAGERERAVDELERAAAAFDSFGAPRYRAEAERELRKLGRTIHRRTAHGTAESGLASLTERELELARLVFDRKTNPQIAAELFLSQKTVETHLRNIFRKVGVANRVELARAVEAAERAETAS
jgi:DNA-binding NarL/FixJ family response regulator